ncbi:MAG: right-handed parallel beta-helix repeat-containing protein [Actinomycetota bacterium]
MTSLIALQGIATGTAAGATAESSTAPGCEEGPYPLLVSASPDRAGASPLCGQQLSGTVYVFLSPAPEVTRVELFLDGVKEQVEKNPPWDLAGGSAPSANPWDTSTIANGDHQLSAQVFLSTALSSASSVTFSVSNSTPPPPSPSPSTTPAPAGSCDGVGVPSGASIQAAIDADPVGTTFCLSGAYDVAQPIEPKDGMSFIGVPDATGRRPTLRPVGSVETGFELKRAGAEGVTIKGLDIAGFSITAIDCWIGMVARANYLHHNLRNGLGCGLESTSSNVLVQNNDIAFNGSAGELGINGGGMKFTKTCPPGSAIGCGVTVRGNHVHDNIGNGIWFDIDSAGDLIRGNTVERNTRKGIFYEISFGPALIVDNVSRDNGLEGRRHSDGGIVVVSSKNVTIRSNTLGSDFNGVGIRIRQDGRPYTLQTITVGPNALSRNELVGCGLPGARCRG